MAKLCAFGRHIMTRARMVYHHKCHIFQDTYTRDTSGLRSDYNRVVLDFIRAFIDSLELQVDNKFS
jgi:hypothetical protein